MRSLLLGRGDERGSRPLEEHHELGELGSCHVTEEPLEKLDEWLVQSFEELESPGRDTGADDSPVALVPLPFDELLSFEPVEKPCDVGVAGDESFGDLRARASGIAGTPQNAQHVVLRQGDAMSLEQAGDGMTQHEGRPFEIQEKLLLEAFEGPRLVNLFREPTGH